MRNTSIALSDHWVEFSRKLVSSGRFGSTSEVIRDGLRLVEQREEAIRRLDEAIDAGLASGPARSFDFDAFLDRKESEHAPSMAAE
jgi:antitoxin ParD1/3/4